MSSQKPREIAARVLQRRENSNDFTENLLERALAETGISPRDRALCQELVYGVVRWQAALDWLIARKTGGRTQKAALQELLRLGLYQIFWLDRIPDHAAVNETVEQARRDGFGAQAGFVNAVLRGYIREMEATRAALKQLKDEQPHVGWSHPEWLVNRWRDRWGMERATRLLEWNNTPPKTFARVNALKADPGKLLQRWREDEDVDYDFFQRDWLSENLIFQLKSSPPIATMPSFRHGMFYVQDPSTLLAVHELSPRPGESILDLCAAPGGKTTLIAQWMNNEGRIVACDTEDSRLAILKDNCARLGITCVEPVLHLEPATTSKPYDRVLVDAPCSNTGVMRRRVDLRWRIQSAEIERLRQAQLELLRAGGRRVKPGGTLIYSTC
ncbi:MAG TPA: 16S rRNA (cytosine(967)-C(5))-methyltransferase RsmB, partial [Verrucomicrobiota bacterium]|nr:16S rRNA (cytosine(967)-C(5))-methyltransferase RsmB [Verrucomicrobiota bacterium]